MGYSVSRTNIPNNYEDRTNSTTCQEVIVRLLRSVPDSSFGERLKELFQGVSNVQLGEWLGVTEGAIRHYMNGRIPPSETLIAISDRTNCSIHWLVKGEGPKFFSHGNEAIPPENYLPADVPERVRTKVEVVARREGKPIEDVVGKLIVEALVARGELSDRPFASVQFFEEGTIRFFRVRLYGEIAAGSPIKVFEEVEEWVEIPEEFKKFGRDLFVLRVRGDSMIEEDILDGDLLICVKAYSEPASGKKVVAMIDGEHGTVKLYSRRKDMITLSPANPTYEDRVYEVHRVKIEGVVVGIYRKQ